MTKQGYDVWIVNPRGTHHSKEHISLSNEEEVYWDFTFEESAIYDVPAIFEYILNET